MVQYRHPFDRIQGIIDKMRCQLCGKHPKLLTVLFLRFHPVILHQDIDPADHVIEMSGQAAEFSFAHRLDLHGIQCSLRILIHRLLQRAKRSENIFAQHIKHDKQEHHINDRKKKKRSQKCQCPLHDIGHFDH